MIVCGHNAAAREEKIRDCARRASKAQLFEIILPSLSYCIHRTGHDGRVAIYITPRG